MAKEKAEKVEPKQANKGVLKANTKQKGEIEVICNKCRASLKVKASQFYAPAGKAKLAVADKDGKELAPFTPKGSLRHNHIAGGDCDGTFRTAKNATKLKAHKHSRDKAIKNKQK